MSLLSNACQPSPKTITKGDRSDAELIYRQDNLAIYQLYCDEFNTLSERNQRYTYHLCRAAIAGRDVYFDQIAPRSLEIKTFLDTTVGRTDIQPDLREKLVRYAVRFYANNGNYDGETSRKFLPEFALEDLPREIQDQIRGVKLTDFIFNREFLPVLVNKNPATGDAVLESSVNFYDRGITRSQIEAAASNYPLNGRFALAGDQLVEEVYRAGAPDIAPGRMADRIERVVIELESALAYAPEPSRPALMALIDYFRTGEKADFDRHCRLWVQDSNSPVDYIMGFIETYDDPLGKRGSFEGGVFVIDSVRTAMIKVLAENAAWFEAKMPWDERYKKKEFTLPTARALKMLIGIGGEGPRCPIGINLPNEQGLRESVGTKNFLLTNVMDSGALDRARLLFGEFIENSEERALALQAFDSRRMADVALHEVVGHGSGRVEPELPGDPLEILKEYASTLEEARADLVSWWFIGDPKLVELGVHSSDVTRRSAYIANLAFYLINLRDVPEGDQFEEDHARAEHLINSFIIARGGARIEKIDGRHFCRLVDEEKAHNAVGELLAEIQRIKSTGDYLAGKKLVETYGLKFDTALRDEVVARLKPLDIPDRIAFAMPEIVPVKNKMGGIKAFEIAYPKDFLGQMIRFGAR